MITDRIGLHSVLLHYVYNRFYEIIPDYKKQIKNKTSARILKNRFIFKSYAIDLKNF